jgi:glycosyltransferase involved in cell wall biosynthesis
MSQSHLPAVSVIVPTTCEQVRWASLERAIDSIVQQAGVAAQAIVVVNGNRYHPAAYELLRARKGVTVLYREVASAPLAQAAGREVVATPFFAFLDDDDEYLPGALAIRVAALLADASLDFVASNGYRSCSGKDEWAIEDSCPILADPVGALCRQNWMASCAGLFRSHTVGPEYFQDPAPYMEWTYLAFRLTTGLKMAWIDEATYRINDSPVSLSKSEAYLRSELDILERVLALPLAPSIRHAVDRKLGRAMHGFAERSRAEGDYAKAWRFHAASLAKPGGWRYLPYSRKLIGVLWRNWTARS